MRHIALKAHAKINLGLAVLGRREDGFHELRTIFQTISLADDLEVSFVPGARDVQLQASGIAVPAGRDNLAVRSAETMLSEFKLRGRVMLRLRKRIPPGSGLGGASSDAAAVMRALTFLSGKRIAADRLIRLAGTLGSDVPFFLYGGTALGIGRGEEVYQLPEPRRRFCVVVFCGQSVSTAEAYQCLRAPLLTRVGPNHNIELFCARINAASSEPIQNDFEPGVFAALPQLAGIKRTLLRCGAEFASLSGSGSAVFGLFPERRQAEAAAQQLRRPRHDVFLTRTVSRREFQLQLPRPFSWGVVQR